MCKEGKPTKKQRRTITEVKDAYFYGLGRGLGKMAAADAVGIDYSTVYRARASDPDFAEAEKAAMRMADEAVENALFEKAKSGNVTAIQIWLYNRCPERWSDRRGKSVTVQQAQIAAHPIEAAISDIDHLSEAAKDAWLTLVEEHSAYLAAQKS